MNERGIRRTGSGWQVFVRVRGEFRSKHFPPDTELSELKAERNTLRLQQKPAGTDKAGTLAVDVAAYLSARKTMRSLADRTLHLEEWRDALGRDRSRHDVTPIEIRRVLDDWKAEKKLSAGSLNRRRTALMSLYTDLDPNTPNPVRAVPRSREQTKPLRLPTRADVLRTIAKIGRDSNRTATGPVLKGAQTRARLLVLAWTGWPAAQLMRLTRDDIRWRDKTAHLRGRQKGTGTRDAVLPLLPQAIAALRELDRLDAWGEFSTSALHKSVTAACKALGIRRWHPYALRHLFLSEMAEITKDDRVVAELGMHTSPAQTRRYTQSGLKDRLRKAVTSAAGKL